MWYNFHVCFTLAYNLHEGHDSHEGRVHYEGMHTESPLRQTNWCPLQQQKQREPQDECSRDAYAARHMVMTQTYRDV